MANRPVTPTDFRTAMGQFASGVTVITAVHDGEAHGMTANAFISVSLEPPLILVSVDKRAHMHELLTQSARYGVSILSAAQVQHSDHFAGRLSEGFSPNFVWVEAMPLIAGATTHLIAEVVACHSAGDHTLFVGEVVYSAVPGGEPLLYFAGHYDRLTSTD